jgi:hypothetical protein
MIDKAFYIAIAYIMVRVIANLIDSMKAEVKKKYEGEL